MKITKGEWKLGLNQSVISDNNGYTSVVASPDLHTPLAERKANAQLIATAPRLLESLKDLGEIFEQIPRDTFTEVGRQRVQAILDKAAAAIREAEGHVSPHSNA